MQKHRGNVVSGREEAIMFGKKQAKTVVIDLTQKRVKTWWGGTKLVPTTKVEQRKMRDIIMHSDPGVTIIDSMAKKERE